MVAVRRVVGWAVFLAALTALGGTFWAQNPSLVSCGPKCAATYCSAAVRCSRVLSSASALESVIHVIHLTNVCVDPITLLSPWRDLATMGSITVTIRRSTHAGIAGA